MVEARGNRLRQLAHIVLSQQDPTIDRFVGRTVVSNSTVKKEALRSVQNQSSEGRMAEALVESGIVSRDEKIGIVPVGEDPRGDIAVNGGAVINASICDGAVFPWGRNTGLRLVLVVQKFGQNDGLKRMTKPHFLGSSQRGVVINIDRKDLTFGENATLNNAHRDRKTGRSRASTRGASNIALTNCLLRLVMESDAFKSAKAQSAQPQTAR